MFWQIAEEHGGSPARRVGECLRATGNPGLETSSQGLDQSVVALHCICVLV